MEELKDAIAAQTSEQVNTSVSAAAEQITSRMTKTSVLMTAAVIVAISALIVYFIYTTRQSMNNESNYINQIGFSSHSDASVGVGST